MKIQCGNFIFTPHLGLTILVMFFLPILLGLSYWQWQRGLYKQELLQSYQESTATQAQSFNGSASLPLHEFQPVVLKGKFADKHHFYLDNQIYEGRAGFDILIPLQLENDEWVLINWGWVPRQIKRQELPNISVPTETITLQGRADFPSHQFVLGTALEQISAAKIILQTIDYPTLSQFLGFSLLPVVILADPDPKSSLIRDWQPPATMPPEKHFGYAVQWLLLAIALCILYVIFCTTRR